MLLQMAYQLLIASKGWLCPRPRQISELWIPGFWGENGCWRLRLGDTV